MENRHTIHFFDKFKGKNLKEILRSQKTQYEIILLSE